MKRGALVLYVFIFLTASICFISANHVVTNSNGGTSYSLNKSIIFTYNITVNNTDINTTANIIQVNITIPVNFTFLTNSSGTNADYSTFTNTSSVLSWGYDTLIMNLTWRYFWFNANSTSVGNYTLNITTLNSTGSYSSTLNVGILSGYINTTNTTSCTENWNCTNWTNCLNTTQTRNCTDLNNCNTTNNKPSVSQSCTIPACFQNWTCTNWSVCQLTKTQSRTCTDSNSCGNITNRPTLNQSCVPPCFPNWTCTEWKPKKCPRDEIQTQTCSDSNNCGTNATKPSESKACTYDFKESGMFLILIILGAIIVLIVIIMLFKFFKGGNKEYNSDMSQGYQQFPPSYPPKSFPDYPRLPTRMDNPNSPPSSNPL